MVFLIEVSHCAQNGRGSACGTTGTDTLLKQKGGTGERGGFGITGDLRIFESVFGE
ncbi:hypothetical protein LCGC14_2735110, partial [marine sediment metagenome]